MHELGVSHQSARMPVSRITLLHLAMSAFTVAANRSGELPMAFTPKLKNRSLTSGLLSNATIY